ncbi:cell adhesion molecule 4-like isoform X4 [Anneissia japonica]|uniref:cell adhesion molecule 4-like isoform X4 n=1 Tax=Anneissia japonica TaxID=1529436 RepID=UPI0014259524|nr:cell adhesion molecule 4-like isoform X4 [Anneissia japonica]
MEYLPVLFILIAGIHTPSTLCVRFVDKPEDVSAIEGKQAVLSCILSSEVNGNVSWWKGLKQLAPNFEHATEGNRMAMSSSKVLDMRMYSLMIFTVELQDEGDYHCEVHGNENLKSGLAHLTIFQTPSPQYPQCFTSRESFIVDSGVTLSCVSEHIKPSVQLHWLDDDGNVISTGVQSNIQGKFVYKNITFNAKKTDSKNTYTCRQTSQVLPEPSNCKIQHLNIYYKPDIQIQHTDIIYVGSDAILFCQSFANPPVMQYKWTSRPKLDSDTYVTDGQVFRILKPTVDHNGTRITCSAKNNVGQTSQTIVLHISINKKIDNGLIVDQNVIENNEYSNILASGDLDSNTSTEDKDISLYVVIIIIVLVVIIVVVVIIIPVYYQCFCKTRTTTDSSGREVYQPTVYYDTRDRTSYSGLYDRSLPRLPSTGQYGHWRHSFASQVPEDLDQ